MRAKLLIVAGRASSSEIDLKLPLTVGRGDEVWLRLKHPTVSRKHCEITEVDGKLFVRDCGSANGTLIDGKPITKAVLEPGHKLTIGPLTFEAQYEPSSNGLSEGPSSQPAAESSVEPSVGTTLAVPDQTSLAPPEEPPSISSASSEAPPPAAKAAADDDSSDFALSLDGEEDLLEPALDVENISVDEPMATIEVSEAALAASEPESDFELDLSLDDEFDVADPSAEASAALNLEKSPSEIDAVVADDDAGATIEADSDALVVHEPDSDFELDFDLDDSPDVDDSAAAEPGVEESPGSADATEAGSPRDESEDAESVRDFSGPVADMPSQILFSVDEIDEPLVDPSDEISLFDPASETPPSEDNSSSTDPTIAESAESTTTDEVEPLEEVDSSAVGSSADEPVAADRSLDEGEFSLNVENPTTAESTDDSSDVELDDDTADGDLSDITDPEEVTAGESDLVANLANSGDTTNEPVGEDKVSSLDIERDDVLASGLEEVTGDADEDGPSLDTREETSPVEDRVASEALDDFPTPAESLELPGPDAEAVDSEPDENAAEIDATPDMDLSEMTLEAIGEPSPGEQDRKDASTDIVAESEEAELDLSELALDAVESPVDDARGDVQPLEAAADPESEPPNLDLSEMALDAIGPPSSEFETTNALEEDAVAEGDELDLSEMALDAVSDAAISDGTPQPDEVDSASDADALDLSELALNELQEPSDSEQPPTVGVDADSNGAHVDEIDAASDEVDFFNVAEDKAVDLESDADSQADALDLSEMAFDAIEMSATDQDDSSEASEFDLPEVEFDAMDDLSEVDDVPGPPVAEGASNDDASDQFVSPPGIPADTSPPPDRELDSGSNGFELPEFAEAADVAEPAGEALIEAEDAGPSEVAFEADSEEFSEFDFGSDEDPSSEVSTDDDSLVLDLPTAPETPANESDAIAESAAPPMDEPPRNKKRGWWPLGRKAKKAETPAVEPTAQAVDAELPVVDAEVSFENDLEAGEVLDVERTDGTSDELDAAALFGESPADNSLNLDLPTAPETPASESGAMAESAAPPMDEPPKKKKRGWWPLGRKAKKAEAPVVEPTAQAVDAELPVADAEVSFENHLEADEVFDVERADGTSDELDAAALFGESSAENGDDVAAINFVDEAPVAFEAADVADPETVEADDASSDLIGDILFEDEDSADIQTPASQGHGDAVSRTSETEDADESIEFDMFDAVEVPETDGESDRAAEVEDLDIASLEEDDSDVVSFDPLDDDEPSTSNEVVAEIEISDAPVEALDSSNVVAEPPSEAKPKRRWWPLGKKKTKTTSAKETSKPAKAKRGWGRRKKKADVAPPDEAVGAPIATEASSPSFVEPVTFEELDHDDPLVTPHDSADDDAMAFLIDAPEGPVEPLEADVDESNDLPDFAAFDDEPGDTPSDKIDEDSGEFMKQLDL